MTSWLCYFFNGDWTFMENHFISVSLLNRSSNGFPTAITLIVNNTRDRNYFCCITLNMFSKPYIYFIINRQIYTWKYWNRQIYTWKYWNRQIYTWKYCDADASSVLSSKAESLSVVWLVIFRNMSQNFCKSKQTKRTGY